MSGLLRRALTALIFVAVVVAGLFTGPYTFVALFGLVAALCLWEFLGLTLERGSGFRKTGGLVVGMAPYLIVSVHQIGWISGRGIDPLSVGLLGLLLLFCMAVYELFSRSEQPIANVAFTALGALYIGLPFTLVLLLAFRQTGFDANLILGMLLLTWANDTGAYLVGSRVGKTPLMPRISPKKTWEGSLGGMAIGLLVAYLLSRFFPDLTMWQWMGLGVIVVVFGSLGDLVESMLKRSKGVKDTGTILPGHGGFLDRFDAFIFMVPFATAYLILIC